MGPESSVSRRRLLQRGFGGALAGVTGCQFSDRGPPTEGNATGERPAWEREADRRIEDHRKGELYVRVRTRSGLPVGHADVSVRMTDPAFKFGTAVDARYLVEGTTPGDPYRTRLRTLFNRAVVEHRNKWKPWEDDQERRLAIRASRWLRRQGLDLRGHAAMWQRFGVDVLPEDIVQAATTDGSGRRAYLTRRGRSHVRDIVDRYGSGVTEWDVVNEQISANRLTDIINPDAPAVEAPEVLTWFEIARNAAPSVSLFLNEYDILTNDRKDHRDAYANLVEFVADGPAGLDGVGMQSHFDGYQSRRNPEAVLETLDRFAAYDVALEVTEYDTFGDGWTEAAEASHLRAFLKTVFSHPSVVGFVMWGFWDGAHWRDNAPLFRSDWTAKPALEVYDSLVFDEWWTDVDGTTGASGIYTTGVFLGRHEITVTANGVSRTIHTDVRDSAEPSIVEVHLP